MRTFGFDLRALEVFVATAKTGNMTLASSQLAVSQSSVSQILAQLESNLGVTLLDRTVRPVELTVAGRYFYDQSIYLLAQADKTQQVITKGSFDTLHLVRVAMVDSLASTLGKPLIDSVKKHTENWTMTTGHSHLHQQGLLSRNVDIIISDDALEQHDNLSRYRILKEPFVLVLPKSFYKRFPQSTKSLQKLATKLDVIRYNTHSLIGKSVEKYLCQQGIEAPDRIQLDNTFAVLSAVASGLGWVITTPLCLLQSGSLSSDLVCLPLPEKETTFRYLTLVSRRNELGDLPERLASDSCKIIEKLFIPKVEAHLSWLGHQILVGSRSN